MEAAFFGAVAACALLSALGVVRSVNLIHATLWLGVTLLSTAALYAMLDASFLAGVQILVYVGGVITLMIFGVMITRRHEGVVVHADSSKRIQGAVVASAFFGVVATAIKKTEGLDGQPPGKVVTPVDLGRVLLHDQLLAFEMLSVLLLAAMVGAIVIARRRDPGAPVRGLPGASPVNQSDVAAGVP